MKKIRGISKNFPKPIICRVETYPSLNKKDEKDFAFSWNWSEELKDYSGVILGHEANPPSSVSIPLFQLSEGNTPPKDGDVILLEPSGLGTILYEKQGSNAILITEKCNSKCILCPQPPKKDEEDLVDLAIQTIKLMDYSTDVLGITGGEPTVTWNGLMKILSVCREYIPNALIQLLTNARVLKDYQKASELVNIMGTDLMVCVPLYADVDTLHDEHTGIRGSFWETIEGIYNLGRLGVLVEIRTVITAKNYQRLAEFAEFIYRSVTFAGNIAFMGIETIGWALENIKELWIDPVKYSSQLETAVKSLFRYNMPVSIYNHPLCILPSDIWSVNRQAISEWKISYEKECETCKVRSECGGFFGSTKPFLSHSIRPILTDECSMTGEI